MKYEQGASVQIYWQCRARVAGEKALQCHFHFGYHKSHMDWSRFKPESLR